MRAYERLLKYVRLDTQSDPQSRTSPSTKKQLVLLDELKKELEEMGIRAERTDAGYLYAKIPGNAPGDPVGFIAHVDTSPEISGKGVKPRIVKAWDGGKIALSEGVTLDPEDFPQMKRYAGESLIVAGGDTLLGADDKAGVAEIMTLAEILASDGSIPHADVWIAFTPDEEIGRGTEHFELDKFPAKYAYTVDGDAVGGIEYENFNAASLEVTCSGISIHPGSAKGRMINAMNVAHEYHSLLPQWERPEHTGGREGFFHLVSMKGDVERADLSYIIRDHDAGKFGQRKKLAEEAGEFLNERYGRKVVSVKIADSYRNMAECFADKMYIVEKAAQAIRRAGREPVSLPIRGGTDGADLTYKGLPCPNLGTGGGNYHGRFEYCVIEEMDKAVDILVQVIRKD